MGGGMGSAGPVQRLSLEGGWACLRRVANVVDGGTSVDSVLLGHVGIELKESVSLAKRASMVCNYGAHSCFPANCRVMDSAHFLIPHEDL